MRPNVLDPSIICAAYFVLIGFVFTPGCTGAGCCDETEPAECPDCETCVKQYRLDFTGWADDNCDECEELNTSFFLDELHPDCAGVYCFGQPESLVDTCYWENTTSVNVCNFSGTILMLVSTDKISINAIIDTSILDFDSFGWQKTTDFARDPDCGTLNNEDIPFHVICAGPSVNRSCLGASATVAVTAV